MSFTITEAFVNHFADNVILLSQQKRSRLQEFTRIKRDLVGEATTFERLAKTEAEDATVRHGPSPFTSQEHSRRWATKKKKHLGEFVDQDDEKAMLISPASVYAQNGVSALERKKDSEIITSAEGTAKTGKDGTGSQALPGGQVVAAASAALTLGKIITANEKLNAKEVEQEGRVFVHGSRQLTNLLNDTTITSQDFNSVRMLMAGTIDQFMGFTWVRSERLTLTGSTRQCLVWQRMSVGFGLWQDNASRISERSDRQYSLYVYLWNACGGVRIEDEGVVRVDCVEA